MEQKRISSNIFVYLIVFIFMVCSVYAAQPAVDLGTADNFVILAKSGISTTGTTLIVGDIGVSPIDSTGITGFGLILDGSGTFATSSLVNGSVYAADYSPPTPAVMTAAISDMEAAYTDAAGRVPVDYSEVGAGNIGGMVLTPGLYKWSTGVTIPTDVTLSGNSTDVWIFQIAGNLDISSGKKVLLSGGAQAKNIFWQVAGTTALGTTSVFNGNILGGSGASTIALLTGAALCGRAFAQKDVTLDANHISATCESINASSPVLTNITLSPPSANLTIGSTLQLNVTSLDQFGLPIAANISYDSSNLSVARVNATSGLVTAFAPGSATINATSGAVSATSIITVETANIKSIPVMDNKLFILLTVFTLILGLYGFKKYGR